MFRENWSLRLAQASSAEHDQSPVPKRCLTNFPAGVILELLRDFSANGVCQAGIGGDQHGSREGIMLCLRQQIGCHVARVCTVICDDQHFTGAGHRINAHNAIHRLLGEGDVDVAGPTDHSTLGTLSVPKVIAAIACSPMQHGAHACKVCCTEHHRIHLAITAVGEQITIS